MKNNRLSILIHSICLLMLLAVLTGCGSKTEEAGSVVYDDMKTAYDQSNLFSSNIGLFTKAEADGSITYGECGSGVIIQKDGNTYYALTAAHVVSDENGQFLVFTTNTKLETEEIPGLEDMNTLTQESYDNMYQGEVLYTSDRDDLAVIRFETEEDLSVIEIAENDPEEGARIMCIGNPQNDWFAISYGEITSGIEKFGEIQGYPSYGMKHSAYIQKGSSGGAAVNEEMKLTGITPGASLSLDGKTFEYGVMIPVSEISICLKDWK